MVTNIGVILGTIGTFLGAVVGAIIMIRKLSPEINHIQIESANTLVAMAEKNAEMSAQIADDLRRRAAIQDNRITELSNELGHAQEQIKTLQQQVSMIQRLKDEVRHLKAQLDHVVAERDALHRENEELRVQIAELEERVRNMETS